MKFMGQEVESAKNVHKVGKKATRAIYAANGITEEVLKQLDETENKMTAEAVEVLSKEVIKSGEAQKLVLGTGDRTLTYTMAGKGESRNPSTGAVTDTYGAFRMSQKRVVPSAIRNSEELEKAQADIEKALS